MQKNLSFPPIFVIIDIYYKWYSSNILYCIVFYCIALYCIVLHDIVLYCSVLYYVVLCHDILFISLTRILLVMVYTLHPRKDGQVTYIFVNSCMFFISCFSYKSSN